jgi:hypothetical protein
MAVEKVLDGIADFLAVVEVVVFVVEYVIANPLVGDLKVAFIQHRLPPRFLRGTIPPESPEDNGPIL